MFSEICPSTSNNFKISCEPSLERGFVPLNRTLSFPQGMFCEKENSMPNTHSESDNKFISSTTLNLLRNLSYDNPIGHFDEDALWNSNDFDESAFLGSKEGQAGFDFEIEHPSKQKQDLVSSHTEFEEEAQNVQNLDNLQPLFYDCSGYESPSIQNEEVYTGKSSPPEQQILSELRKKNPKIQRKKIQKTFKKEKDSAPKKSGPQKVASSNRKIIPKRESKNIVKNYGKAMATFSLSEVATPYLKEILLTHGVKTEAFKTFVINNKEKIDGIGTLRNLLFADIIEDDPQNYKLKCVFRDICEVFARDFALNWIFSCRSQYKSALLEFRFKMLRRVRDPSSFTFLKPQ